MVNNKYINTVENNYIGEMSSNKYYNIGVENNMIVIWWNNTMLFGNLKKYNKEMYRIINDNRFGFFINKIYLN